MSPELKGSEHTEGGRVGFRLETSLSIPRVYDVNLFANHRSRSFVKVLEPLGRQNFLRLQLKGDGNKRVALCSTAGFATTGTCRVLVHIGLRAWCHK